MEPTGTKRCFVPVQRPVSAGPAQALRIEIFYHAADPAPPSQRPTVDCYQDPAVRASAGERLAAEVALDLRAAQSDL